MMQFAIAVVLSCASALHVSASMRATMHKLHTALQPATPLQEDVIDLGDVFGDPHGGDGGVLTLPADQYLGFLLRFNEIAPTAEWVNITIGLQGSSMPVVPGPIGLAVLPVAMGFIAPRRRR